MKNIVLKFDSKVVAGFLIHGAITSLVQDSMGKEAYLKSVTEHWVSAWVTVPFALVSLLIAVWIWYLAEAA